MSIRPALIALGSNLGDRRAILDGAIGSLATTPGVVVTGVSAYHETPPVGGPPGQGPFLNAAAALSTTLDAESLHRVLLDIERAAGRVRAVRWGERSLDLDLLLFDRDRIETPQLTVPHPRMALRRFVLAPLAEVAPAAIDPVTGRTIADLLANLDRRPSLVAIDGSAAPERLPPIFLGVLAGLVARIVDPTPSPINRVDSAPDPPADRWLITRLVPGPRPSLNRFPILPTFLVCLVRHGAGVDPFKPFDPKELGDWGPIPRLVPEAEDPARIAAEILDACLATRS